MKSKYKTAAILSVVVMVLTTVATTIGLFATNIYRDNSFVKTAWEANDWVTLLLVPVLAIVLVSRRSVIPKLVWVGLLGYLAYNYAFYLFGAAFNVLFPFYLSIVSLSCFALIFLVLSLPLKDLRFEGIAPRIIAGYLCIIGFTLLAVEVPPIVAFIANGKLPQALADTGHPTAVVYALDLPYVVPVSLLAAIWLWQKRSAGILLAALMLVKGASYGLVLCAGSLLLANRGIGSDPLLPFYAFLSIGGTAGLIFLLKGVKSADTNTQSAQKEKESSFAAHALT